MKVKVRRPQICTHVQDGFVMSGHVICNTFDIWNANRCLYCYLEIKPDTVINIILCSILQGTPVKVRTHKVTCINIHIHHIIYHIHLWSEVDIHLSWALISWYFGAFNYFLYILLLKWLYHVRWFLKTRIACSSWINLSLYNWYNFNCTQFLFLVCSHTITKHTEGL